MSYKLLLFVFLSILFFSFELPKEWVITGDKPECYKMGIAKNKGLNGSNAATIKSIEPEINGFGTLMQSCLPDIYLGKRIRMKGMLKTKKVSDWSGLWLRIDTEVPIDFAYFDNMHDGKINRSISGTSDWTEYEIVLDVHESATNISYGALLTGTGQIWFDNLIIEIVDESIELTGKILKSSARKNNSERKEPINLNFEK